MNMIKDQKERRNYFFSIERLLETKVKDEGLGDIITQCFLRYSSKGNPEEIPYFDEEELNSLDFSN